jgi:hypothetical protein
LQSDATNYIAIHRTFHFEINALLDASAVLTKDFLARWSVANGGTSPPTWHATYWGKCPHGEDKQAVAEKQARRSAPLVSATGSRSDQLLKLWRGCCRAVSNLFARQCLKGSGVLCCRLE